MRRGAICTIILQLYILSAYSQNVISGNISDSSGKAWGGIMVTISDSKTSQMVAFAQSYDSGNFTIESNSECDSLLFMATGMLFGKYNKVIPNKTQTLNIKKEEEALEIKEVIVKSPLIIVKSDTVIYDVSRFIDANDVAIEDVIKRLPGVSVDASGVIKYQDRAINKFYIEDMDLLQGRYSVATKNIDARDISKIEIMENHQPIKAMKGIKDSDAAAMNLRLKDDVKSVFMLTAQLGAGAEIDNPEISPLWDATVTGMIFARNMQSMAQYKGNNSGVNIYDQLRSLTTRNMFGSENYTSISMPSPPSIDEDRYLFNNTQSGSLNQLFRDKGGNDFTANIIYVDDRIDRNSQSSTSIYLPDQDATVIDEDVSSLQQHNILEANLQHESNQKEGYLNNNLSLSREWNSSLGSVISDNIIDQELSSPSMQISHSLYNVKNRDGKGYELSLNSGYKSEAQDLTVYSGLYPDIFNGGEEYSAIRQNIDSRSGYANASFSLLSLLNFANISVDPISSISYNYNSLNSDILTTNNSCITSQLSSNDFVNNLIYNKINANLGLNLRYAYKKIKVNISLPVAYNYIDISNAAQSQKDSHSLFWFQPRASLFYTINNKLKLNASYGHNNQTAGVQTLYSGSILTSYRSIGRYDNLLPTSSMDNSSLSLEYKSIFSMFFANLRYSYFNIKNDMVTSTYYDDILALTSRQLLENVASSQSFSGNISKGFDFVSTKLSISSSYGISHSEQYIQEELVRFENELLGVEGSLTMRPAKWLGLQYVAKWNQTLSKPEGGEDLTPIRSMTNEGDANINITKSLYLSTHYESYYNSAAIGDKYMNFVDLGVNYNAKGLNLSLKCTNLVNNNRYEVARYSSLDEYRYSYQIRPRMIMLSARFKIM